MTEKNKYSQLNYPSYSSRRCCGFTVVEFIFILVITAILVGIGVSKWQKPASMQVGLQAAQLQETLQYVRAFALSNHQSVTVVFASDRYGSTLLTPSTTLLPAGVTLSATGLNGGSQPTLAFCVDGSPASTTCAVPLTSAATITLTSSSGGKRTLTITPQTGAIILN